MRFERVIRSCLEAQVDSIAHRSGLVTSFAGIDSVGELHPPFATAEVVYVEARCRCKPSLASDKSRADISSSVIHQPPPPLSTQETFSDSPLQPKSRACERRQLGRPSTEVNFRKSRN